MRSRNGATVGPVARIEPAKALPGQTPRRVDSACVASAVANLS